MSSTLVRFQAWTLALFVLFSVSFSGFAQGMDGPPPLMSGTTVMGAKLQLLRPHTVRPDTWSPDLELYINATKGTVVVHVADSTITQVAVLVRELKDGEPKDNVRLALSSSASYTLLGVFSAVKGINRLTVPRMPMKTAAYLMWVESRKGAKAYDVGALIVTAPFTGERIPKSIEAARNLAGLHSIVINSPAPVEDFQKVVQGAQLLMLFTVESTSITQVKVLVLPYDQLSSGPNKTFGKISFSADVTVKTGDNTYNIPTTGLIPADYVIFVASTAGKDYGGDYSPFTVTAAVRPTAIRVPTKQPSASPKQGPTRVPSKAK